VRLGRVEAGCLAHRAIDVGDQPAATADDVVMVVTNPRLEAGRAAGGLDPPSEAGAGERAQHVVHRLGGDRVEPFAYFLGDRVDVEMAGRRGENLEHGKSRARHAQPAGPEELFA
jgi:hypothetical protein